MLSNLRILDLTEAALSTRIRPDLFLKLRRLEEFYGLDRIVNGGRGRRIDVLAEMGTLSRLTSLELQVHNPELCYIDIPGIWHILTRFQIVIQTENILGYPSHLRDLRLVEEIRGKEVANWVLVLMGRTNFLGLEKCHDLQCLMELGAAVAQGMDENLEALDLCECSKMECLVSSNKESNQNAFLSNLEELFITDTPAFVEICKGTPPPRLLYKLKMLFFDRCASLVTAIPRKLIHNLRNLEDLRITNCFNIIRVVEMEEEEEEEKESLVSSYIRISEPLLLPIFPNLKTLEMKETKIRHVFTMRIARNLSQLEKLDLEDCSQMEVLFKYEDGEDILDQDTAILPRLKKLRLWSAQKLKSFTNRNLVMELPSLEELHVRNCFILERLPSGTTSVPNLKNLEMGQELFDSLEWEDQGIKARLEAIRSDLEEGEEVSNSEKED